MWELPDISLAETRLFCGLAALSYALYARPNSCMHPFFFPGGRPCVGGRVYNSNQQRHDLWPRINYGSVPHFLMQPTNLHGLQKPSTQWYGLKRRSFFDLLANLSAHRPCTSPVGKGIGRTALNLSRDDMVMAGGIIR